MEPHNKANLFAFLNVLINSFKTGILNCWVIEEAKKVAHKKETFEKPCHSMKTRQSAVEPVKFISPYEEEDCPEEINDFSGDCSLQEYSSAQNDSGISDTLGVSSKSMLGDP